MSNMEPNSDFESLLGYIKRARGFDFTGYKRSSLMRRVLKRMQTIEIESFNDYLDHLEVHPGEFSELFNTILINVTSFFRDRSTWDYIGSEIVPQIVARKESYEPIRAWSAGCASGQEAYTLAIVLTEVLGIESFKNRVKIYATDLDEEALNQARHASYSIKDVADISAEMLERYFDRTDEHSYTFRKDLRRSVIFGRHNLVQDAPISRIDLLICRNTLMYFNAEAQAKIIARFHFALNDNGFLCLGKAEMLLSHHDSFLPIDLKRRIFTQMPRLSMRTRLLMMGNNNDDEVNYLTKHVRLRDAAFDASPVAQLVVDLNSLLILANQRARELFGLATQDLGRPLQDLELSYRPVELRSCLDQTYNERRIVGLRDVEWTDPAGDSQYFDVQLIPLFDLDSNLLGATITFTDVSRYKRLQQELEHSNQELEMAYEELQSSNEELETTNEELQSSNEELETTNEELQSTNEELETMNEELQSSNEELQTLNEELQRRTGELNAVNSFLSSILASMRGGVVVVDRDLRVLVWNAQSEDLWGLRADEVEGQHFLNLDIGLPVDMILQPIRTCLAADVLESSEVILPAVNRRGRAIECRVICTSLSDNRKTIQGVILSMEEQNGG